MTTTSEVTIHDYKGVMMLYCLAAFVVAMYRCTEALS